VELTETRRAAWRRFADAARRANLPALAPAVEPRTSEELDAARAPALRALEAAIAKADQELKALQPAAAPADDGGWKQLEEAVRKLEQDLRAPASLRQRLDEGRRSMLPKVERLVHSRLTPIVKQQGRRLVATVGEDGLAALRSELPEWVDGWSHYVLSWVALDLARETAVAWNRRDGELPVPPPVMRPFEPPRIQSSIELPDVAIGRDVAGFAGGILRNARSIAYGLLSLTFLFGVARTSIPWWVYVVGFLAAVAIGAVMASEERAAERRKLEAEVRQKAEQATWEATRQWLDRMADKLAEHIRSELHVRREELVAWWVREVRPRALEAERTAAAARARADEARMAVPRIQEARRAAAAALAALEAVATA
jgi:hypothetical protein